MKQDSQSKQRTADSVSRRNWLLVILGAIFLGLTLLWSKHELLPSSPIGDLESTSAATESNQSASPPSLAKVSPGEDLPEPGDGGDESPVVSPYDIVDHVAQLLGGSPNLDIEQLSAMIDISGDPALPLQNRIAAIRWLARFGNDEAVDVLERLLLNDASSAIRSAVATALGESEHLSVKRILVALLVDDDVEVVLSAIGGLVSQGDPDTTRILAALVADEHQPDEIRAAAAAALGNYSNVSDDLLLAFENSEGELAIGALMGLARQPFDQSEAVFKELFADPNTPVEMKLEAIGALGEGTPEAVGLLLELARNEDDPELRSAAIDALMISDEPGNALDALGELALNETSADVRADLYNSLALHAGQASAEPNVSKLIISTLSETMPRTQLEGYRMVASMLNHEYQSGIAETFDKSMVAWLQRSAEYGDDQYTRFLSIDALKLANTPGAHQALINLSYSADPKVSRSAVEALRLTDKAGGTPAP